MMITTNPHHVNNWEYTSILDIINFKKEKEKDFDDIFTEILFGYPIKWVVVSSFLLQRASFTVLHNRNTFVCFFFIIYTEPLRQKWKQLASFSHRVSPCQQSDGFVSVAILSDYEGAPIIGASRPARGEGVVRDIKVKGNFTSQRCFFPSPYLCVQWYNTSCIIIEKNILDF
jgi:hypothetical protein